MMRYQIPVTPYRPGPPHVGPPDPDCTREEIAARIDLCRRCDHAAPGSATCEVCEVRCLHLRATIGGPLVAIRSSICPANRWPLLA